MCVCACACSCVCLYVHVFGSSCTSAVFFSVCFAVTHSTFPRAHGLQTGDYLTIEALRTLAEDAGYLSVDEMRRLANDEGGGGEEGEGIGGGGGKIKECGGKTRDKARVRRQAHVCRHTDTQTDARTTQHSQHPCVCVRVCVSRRLPRH